jgi:nicotinate-nucleotide adenylyltransferase
VIGLFGGAFDPPHNGHVELVRAAKRALGLDQVVVVVASDPGHKRVETPAEQRLELARAAFPGETVQLDPHERTIDMLRAHPEWEGATFLLGADEFAALPSWKEPDELLRLVRIGVATRPGYHVDSLGDRFPSERISFFDLEPMPIASRELRARLDRGEDVHEFVPAAVWEIIERDRLYGRGYTGRG